MKMSEIITFNCPIDGMDTKKIISMMPHWNTVFLEASFIDQATVPKLVLRFLIEARNVDEIKKWQNEFEEKNKYTYSIHSTPKCAGRYTDFRQKLHCQRSTRCQKLYHPSVKTGTKNTMCPSKMSIVLHSIKERYRGKNIKKHKLLTKMPCEIKLIASHNHDITGPDALRFRKVSDDVKERLLELFQMGHSPGNALETIKREIKMNYENYEEILTDRKYCPSYNYCYHIYMTEFKKKCDSLDLDPAGKKSQKKGSKNLCHKGTNIICNSATEINNGHEILYCIIDSASSEQEILYEINNYFPTEINGQDILHCVNDPTTELCGEQEISYTVNDYSAAEINGQEILHCFNDCSATELSSTHEINKSEFDMSDLETASYKFVDSSGEIKNDQEVFHETNNSEVEIGGGQEILQEINKISLKFLQDSPSEVTNGLAKMLETLQKVKKPSAFASLLRKFGTKEISRKKRGSCISVPLTSTRLRKPNLSRKASVRNHLGKTLNNPIANKKLPLERNVTEIIKIQFV